ncbi:unnamed protein product [Polarella glacialis]|uniref:Peptidase C14 caspase domain-containing protein n=1 Tax=Polarella glacialis TaxID=89957 RepID=A0A813EMR2_POLGL|nr:unnamed protein product [Polarella glacialis]CAE8603336.1 unnamed protein product [Polarella glacialis]
MFGASRGYTSHGKPVRSAAKYERRAEEGEVHVVLCALDYKGTSCPLTCTMDGNNMAKLLQQCGVRDVSVMYDNQCTKVNVERKMREVASRCKDNDYFVFYYSGHGSNVPDLNGDEEDGQDEALCFMGPNGELASKYFMTDDEFAAIVSDCVPESTRIILMCDCCHSGTIGDLDGNCWAGHEAISISGCKDNQTSGDMGKGGIFTHSLLLAVEKLSKAGEEDFSVGTVYNATLMEDDRVFKSAQDIQIRCTPGLVPGGMAWPLVPKGGSYKSPLSMATSAVAQSAAGLEGASLSQQIGQTLLSYPQLLQQYGINPAQIQGLIEGQGMDFSSIVHADNEDYMEVLAQLGTACGPGLKNSKLGAECCTLM